ncbi:MAG: hypothetical protein IK086_01295 [Clostridia bacterium]|nr:hypothetical protein [Clostridia bacterium]
MNGSVVRVSSDFFNRTSYNTRLGNLRRAILGLRTADSINPDCNPNGDATWGDVVDYVHAKNRAVADNG